MGMNELLLYLYLPKKSYFFLVNYFIIINYVVTYI